MDEFYSKVIEKDNGEEDMKRKSENIEKDEGEEDKKKSKILEKNNGEEDAKRRQDDEGENEKAKKKREERQEGGKGADAEAEERKRKKEGGEENGAKTKDEKWKRGERSRKEAEDQKELMKAWKQIRREEKKTEKDETKKRKTEEKASGSGLTVQERKAGKRDRSKEEHEEDDGDRQENKRIAVGEVDRSSRCRSNPWVKVEETIEDEEYEVLLVDEEPEDEELQDAWDDVDGRSIDVKLVRSARKEEMEFAKKIPVCEEVELEECWNRMGKPPISTKWVDHDKGRGGETDVRSRWVARDFKGKGDKDRPWKQRKHYLRWRQQG